MDETGWRVFLRANRTYQVRVYLCCTDPNAQVTLEIDGLTVWLTPAGGGWYEGTFTAPDPLVGTLRLCVVCNLIQRCSDGQVLIDPEGTVYDQTTGQELAGAEVACYEDQSGTGSAVFDLWPADAYGQENPQTTGTDGYYSFFTPPGTYRVQATASGFQSHLSPDLVVTDAPVHYDVYVTPVITEAAHYVVRIGPLGFDPPVLHVAAGSVVEWVNVDTAPHASTSITPTVGGTLNLPGLSGEDAWDSGLLDTGDSFKKRLDSVGTYTYQDGENAVVTGQLIVEHLIYLPLLLRNQ
jgi:plastocyanin